MSPLKIRILLHYYALARDYQQAEEWHHSNSPAVYEAITGFVDDGLLRCRFGDINWACSNAVRRSGSPDTEAAFFIITDKGRAMVNALMAVQIPVCRWVQPEISK